MTDNELDKSIRDSAETGDTDRHDHLRSPSARDLGSSLGRRGRRQHFLP
jgi:hypothetical protein